MTRPLVAFDESGNTGQNLGDAAQPIFALASVLLSEVEARASIAASGLPGTGELKFARLRSTAEGRGRVVSLLSSDLLQPSTTKISVCHKPFMITTKIVDILIEELHHRVGANLYKDRANLGLANLWYHVIPTFCGETAFLGLHDRFLLMVRETSPETIDAFYGHVEHMRELNVHAPFERDLAMLAATRRIAREAINGDERTALDPAIPAFFSLAAQWTAELNRPFDVVHDQSKPLALEKERLELVMTEAIPPQVLPGNGPKWQLPLLSTGIRFADSASVVQIQVADLIAGAAAAYCAAIVRQNVDSFIHALGETRLPALILAGRPVWPTTAMTPVELGEGDDGAGVAITIDIAAQERQRRRGARKTK